MDPKMLTKQMIVFSKSSFDSGFSVAATFQEQNERMVNSFLEQANWMPRDGKKVLSQWLEANKKGWNEFKRLIDESYRKVEEYFAD